MKDKKCSKCKAIKPTTEFNKDRQKRGGISSACKSCNYIKNQTYRRKRAEELRREKTVCPLYKCCKRCKKTMSHTKFYRDKGHNDGLSSWCIECSRKRQRARYETNKPKILGQSKDYYIKHGAKVRLLRQINRYGIDESHFVELVIRSQGLCDCCERQLETGGKASKLNIDHDHSTGLIRGILCTNCNTGIGMLGDDVDTLTKAIDYLSHPPG